MKLENGDIARVAGVAVGTVSNWRRRSPDTDALLKLARYFGVTPEWLLNGEDVLHTTDTPTQPPAED